MEGRRGWQVPGWRTKTSQILVFFVLFSGFTLSGFAQSLTERLERLSNSDRVWVETACAEPLKSAPVAFVECLERQLEAVRVLRGSPPATPKADDVGNSSGARLKTGTELMWSAARGSVRLGGAVDPPADPLPTVLAHWLRPVPASPIRDLNRRESTRSPVKMVSVQR